MAILNNSNAISSGGYDVNNSLRFRDSASAYLSRTFGSATNYKIQTLSAWVKRGLLSSSTTYRLMGGYDGSAANSTEINFNNDTLRVEFGGAANNALITTQVFRDPSAWYHIVIAIDTTQATASNRVKMYVNGTQVTAFGTANYPAQNANSQLTSANANNSIGAGWSGFDYFDGYMTDINFIDGQALTPSSFGETDTTTGSWKPKAYTGTYGTNGFYLKFSDIATTSGSNAGLGKDFSGNANYWTTNNISVTAGTTYDAMTDSPTLTSATVANYATWNPAISFDGATLINAIMTNGNLTATDAGSASYNSGTSATIGVNSGKWYWENTIGSGTPLRNCNGISFLSNSGPVGYGVSYDPYISSGAIRSYVSGSATAIQTGVGTIAAGDIVAIALDADAQTIKWYKNNVQVGTTLTYTSYLPTGYSFVYPGFWTPNLSGASISTTFGQRPFTYTPPAGYKALNTYNLPDSTIKKGNTVMDATLYTGTGSSLSVTNAGAFKPDFVWVKGRSGATDNALYDSVRGTTKDLVSNSTAAETTQAQGLTAFGTGGFTVGTLAKMNTSAATYVGWQWQAGQGTTSSNTNGTITSTVSVNTTAGFSIVTYTGNGSAGATIGHSLGIAPKMFIVKNRSNGGNDWSTWHTSISPSSNFQVYLSSSAASLNTWNVWNSTSPSTTTLTLGTDALVNGNGQTYVAYCWAEIAGFSKFGSYTGNDSADGPFVYLGFRPKFVLIKRTDSTSNWYLFDTARNTYNVMKDELLPNSSNAEADNTRHIDTLSNGFKIRADNASQINANGATMIYMAFAEVPTKFANAR